MPDIINAVFELLGFVMCLINSNQLYKDKQVRGVNVWTMVFFASWGYWNVFYYPYLGQIASTIAAILLALSNTLYACMLFYYIKLEKKKLQFPTS